MLPENAPQFGPRPEALLSLGTPSRPTRVGRIQAAHVRHPWAIAALRFLVTTAPSASAPLVALTYAQYRAAFMAAQAPTAPLRFTPHCPRAGAATQGRLEGRPVRDLMVDGRWASETSLRTYLDVATATAARTLREASVHRPLLLDHRLVGPVFAFFT